MVHHLLHDTLQKTRYYLCIGEFDEPLVGMPIQLRYRVSFLDM